MRPHGILWEGASPIDGAPIVAIATLASASKANAKTGVMAQVYILRRDISPVEAVQTGSDSSVCGSCPMRGDGMRKRACYVQLGNGPLSTWRAYQRGRYERITPEHFAGHSIRWGAYGDPAMIPAELVSACNRVAKGWTGYTHQWARDFASPFRGVLMASVETRKGEDKARSQGWGTFRAGLPDGSDKGRATLCASERTGAKCVDCLKCDGSTRAIYIPAHGAGSNFVPTVKLLRKAV